MKNIISIALLSIVTVVPVLASPKIGFTSANRNKNKKHLIETENRVLVRAEFEDKYIPKPAETSNCNFYLPFCEEINSYPTELVEKAIEKNSTLKAYFGPKKIGKEELGTIISESRDNFICKSIIRTIFPKAGKNKNNEWKFILNKVDKDSFRQDVHIEICKNEEGKCDISGNALFPYRFYCKQKYLDTSLLTLDDQGSVSFDTFVVPISCDCAYKSV